jgi:hypothetical protein
MNRQEYYPIAVADQAVWLANFQNNLADQCESLGIPAEKYQPVLQDARYLRYLLAQWLNSVRTFGPTATAFIAEMEMGAGPMMRPTLVEPPLPDGVVEVEGGALRRIFAFVQVIKRTPGSGPSAVLLRLNPRPDAAERPVPVFQLSTQPGEVNHQWVRVRFFKYGHQGVQAQCRRGAPDAPWEDVGVTTASPWLDKRPLLVAGQPEVREYRLRFWDKGEGNGEWTDVSKITVSP